MLLDVNIITSHTPRCAVPALLGPRHVHVGPVVTGQRHGGAGRAVVAHGAWGFRHTAVIWHGDN